MADSQNDTSRLLAGVTSLSILGSADHASAVSAALEAAGATGITVVATEQAANQVDATAGVDGERGRVLALCDLCPDTTMSASLKGAIEGGTEPGAFAIDLAKNAKARGASVDDLKAGAVHPDQLPANASAGTDPNKPKTGLEQASGILALAASAGIKAAAHLRKPA